MRLSNYIYDHGMRFPDIADFPECTALKFADDIAVDEIDVAFNTSFETLDFDAFCRAHHALIDVMNTHVPLDPDAQEYRDEQDRRIRSAANLFFDSTRNQTPRDDIAANEVFNSIHESGYFAIGVDPTPINQLLEPHINELLSRDDNLASPHFYDRAIQFRPETHPALFSMMTDFFERTGMLAGATKYNQNADLAIEMIALHIARPNDTHHYQTFRDCITSSQLVSLHTDPKYNLIKSLIYLSDVSLETGPFTYIPKSNRWWYDETERVFAYGNSTGNYLDSPAARRAALAAPKRYRRNAIVGRLIADGTPTSDMLLSSMLAFTHEANCILFDPLGLHRGGLCQQGERIALQILLRPKTH